MKTTVCIVKKHTGNTVIASCCAQGGVQVLSADKMGDSSRGGSRIFGDYSSNLLRSEPRPPCLRDTPTIWANDKPCVFIVASYS